METMYPDTAGPIRYPDVIVPLPYGENAFIIIAAVERAMRRAGVTAEERTAFRIEATSGDYDNVIRTAERWVAVS